jgi:tetratricopeptide (TPR) repeat protein
LRLHSVGSLKRLAPIAFPALRHGLILTLLLTIEVAPGAKGQMRTPSAELGVRVTGLQHEQFIEQAQVELVRFPSGVLLVTFSDSTGRVLFPGIRPDSYIVRVSKSGYRTEEVRVDIRAGDTHHEVSVQLRSEERGGAFLSEGIVSSRTLSIPAPALEEFQKGAELLRMKKDPKESIAHLQRAIDMFPAYHEAYFLKGMAQLQMNSLEEAHAALAKSVELEPKFLQAYHPLGVVLISLKRYTEAEYLLLSAMELDKDGWQWPFELARCYATQGQWNKAFTYGQMAHDRPNPPSKVYLLMADLYSNTGNPEKAIEEFERFAKLDPDSPFMPRVKQAISQLRTQKQN